MMSHKRRTYKTKSRPKKQTISYRRNQPFPIYKFSFLAIAVISILIITGISNLNLFPIPQVRDYKMASSPIPTISSNSNGERVPDIGKYQTSPKKHHLKYSNSADSIEFTTYGGLSDYFSSKPISYYHKFETEVLLPRVNSPDQNIAMQGLLSQIKKKSPDNKKQALIVIGMVQHLQYGTGKEWEFPYTAVHLERGLCGDKSLLTAYLLKELGYDVVMFNWADHSAIGIKVIGPDSFRNTGYAYVETTRPTIPTYYPFADNILMNKNPEILHISNGGKVIDFTDEQKDARLYATLLRYPVLEPYEYNKFMDLSNKYDIYFNNEK